MSPFGEAVVLPRPRFTKRTGVIGPRRQEIEPFLRFRGQFIE